MKGDINKLINITLFLVLVAFLVVSIKNNNKNVIDFDLDGNEKTEELPHLIVNEEIFRNAQNLQEDELNLYMSTVSTLLKQDLWNVRDAFDTGQYLMVPLWYAYKSNNKEFMEGFDHHFFRFTEDILNENSEFHKLSNLQKNQYLYLVSNYLLLSNVYNRSTSIPDGLLEFIEGYIIDYYYNYKASWGRGYGLPNTLDLILSGEDVYVKGKTFSYYRAFTDNESFPLAIIANLYTIQKISKNYNSNTEIYKEAMDYTYNIFISEIVWVEGGWIFQPGVWNDHKAFQYAKVANINDYNENETTGDVAWDTSHFKRYSIWLQSFKLAQDNLERKEYFDKLINGLSQQLLNHVLVPPNEDNEYYRVKNYMNGDNGIFRWEYHEEGSGYLPYQQSKSLLFGFWSFLLNDTIKLVYSDIADQFPLDNIGKEIYQDPITVREQNPIYTSWEMYEIICKLAEKL